MRLGRRTVRALLDTGSEISLINARTARLARTLGIRINAKEAQIYLANSTAAVTTGSITLPIELQGRSLQHPSPTNTRQPDAYRDGPVGSPPADSPAAATG